MRAMTRLRLVSDGRNYFDSPAISCWYPGCARSLLPRCDLSKGFLYTMGLVDSWMHRQSTVMNARSVVATDTPRRLEGTKAQYCGFN